MSSVEMIRAAEARVATLADTVRALKADDRTNTEAIGLHVAQLLAAKQQLIDELAARAARLESMVRASGKPVCDAVRAELQQLEQQRATLLPKNSKADKKGKKKEQQEKTTVDAASPVTAECAEQLTGYDC